MSVDHALNTIGALIGSNSSVGNGECYALASYYERLISPDATVGLGAGVGAVSGAVGDTIKAANIGIAYRWSANGWSVSTDTGFQAGQIVTLKATSGNIYGHVVIIESVSGSTVTVLEQNIGGRRYPVRNTYDRGWYASQVVHYITPPGTVTTQAPVAPRSFTEYGTMTVTVDAINVRRAPHTTGKIVDVYKYGESFNYDKVIIDQNGFLWVSFIGRSGNRNYVATGATKDGRRYGAAWGTFK